MRKLLLVGFLSSVVYGCSSTIPINYVASPVIRGNGDIAVGKFIYSPALAGVVKHNQYQSATVSLGTMYLSEDANKLIEGAIKKELIASGFNVDNKADIVITGDITRFLYDWVGVVEVDFYLDVNYTVTKNGSVVFKDVIKTHKASPKNINQDSEATRAVVSENISLLFESLRDRKIL